ncbi:MAG: S8/S53 family peptidase [Candidatus Heimdallarchaeota archaeon]|nr:S8/S53 family peptidase [Candidatus Heimdallarchaeota archaeon]MDH5644677.1 S8/S53 family peptidase [Candidatus Heimdallarchaeota archaeon]
MMLPNKNKTVKFYVILLVVILAGITLLVIFLTNEIKNEDDSVRVGVVDSGCSENQDKFVEEYKSFTTEEYGFPSTETRLYDNLNHGEFVCQLINDENPDAILYSARIANSHGLLTFESVFAAVDWLVLEKDVDIINLSLGSDPIYYDWLNNAFYQYANKVIIVASSGNDGGEDYQMGNPEWPSSLPWVIGVGATYPEDPNSIMELTTLGRTNYGPFGSEYSDNGEISRTKRGTSFSTPIITGKVSQIVQYFKENNIDYKPRDINTMLTLMSSNWQTNTFSERIGWGVPEIDTSRIKQFSPQIIIQGNYEIDPLIRLYSENHTINWKFTSYGYSNEELRQFIPIFTGRGVDYISNYDIDIYDWGGILRLHITNYPNQPTNLIEIQIGNSNSISYQWDTLQNQTRGKILLDHRNSINGLAHQFGEYSRIDNIFRNNGYITQHVVENKDIDLTEYDAVLVSDFAEKILVTQYTFNRQIRYLDDYLNYISTGGNLFIFGNHPINTDSSQIATFYNSLNVTYSGLGVDSEFDLSEPNTVLVNNFTEFDIFNGVSNLRYYGSDIKSSNNNTTELGWYRHHLTDGVRSWVEYRSIGVNGTINNGNYYIFGASNFIKNEEIISYTNLKGDRFIQNIIRYFLN